jgi:NADH-quinone oxidoreductase subunit L
MFNMGGLREKMPVTFWTFLIGGLALSGFPLVTAGFWSKDAIFAGAYGGGYIVVFIVLALAALLTAFYTMRQITLTFLGEGRTPAAEHASESRWTMTLPLGVLAFFAVVAGWVGIPEKFPLLGGLAPNWWGSFVGTMLPSTVGSAVSTVEAETSSLIPLLTSLVVSLGGLYLGWAVYKNLPVGAADPVQGWLGGFYTVLKRKYYIDEIYHFIFIRPAIWLSDTFTALWMDRIVIDGFLHAIARGALWLGSAVRQYIDLWVVNGAGDLTGKSVRDLGFWLKKGQTGRVQQYLITSLLVILVVSAVLIFILLRSA